MPRPLPRLAAIALLMASLLPLPLHAENGQAGAYLAARQASLRNDFAEAAKWYDRVLLSDPANPALLEGAAGSHLAMGQITEAATSGRALLAGGTRNQIAYLAVLTANAQAGDFAKVLADQADGNTIGALIDRLMVAWAKVGTGNMTAALTDFDAIIATTGTGAFGIYHKALALAASGDFEGADRLLSGPDAAPALQLRRAVLAHVQILSQLERSPEAVALIDKAFGTRPDPGMVDLRRRLVAGETLPFDTARNATDGMAEVFFTLATALNDQADQTYVLLYVRAAAALRPDHVEAQLMAAGILDKLERYELAFEVLAKVPPTDPAYIAARIGQADAAIRLGRIDESVAILQKLVVLKPDDISAQTALGDALRRQDRCDLAIPAYSAAIALVPTPEPGNWPLFYKRAGCEFQTDNWPRAEADFRRALALAPNEPRLLNELGYSYVDRGENLIEALDMIQRAVAASPETGYIVDSLAWAYYRLGRFQEAVAPQEKASRLMPVDPIVTDHLGDIYWQVGRKREAQFQWRRALSFNPDDKEKPRIQRKIEVGLDIVLQEEKDAKGNGN
jgi:tetratricopeptide (TPR) repeat protein